MSEPLTVGFVAEGATDLIMLQAALKSILGEQEFVPQALQPEVSEAFVQVHGQTSGWAGVYHWCRQAARQAQGPIRQNPLFALYDVLVVQVDADVARRTYSSAHISDAAADLPCEKKCPPPDATTNALRAVVLRWMGERTVPPRTVFCTPSKSLEAWVLAALFPSHKWITDDTLECRQNPGGQLSAAQSRAKKIHKRTDVYRGKSEDLAAGWPRVRSACTEAERFSTDLLKALAMMG